MGIVNRDTGEIGAKLVYYGPAGAGTSASLDCIHRKLKREHRGELQATHAPGDESACYELLPVQLGAVRGFQTSIRLYTVPTGEQHAEERRQVLRGADGVVFCADTRSHRYAATLASAVELETFLRDEGRSFSDIHLLVQYSHCDEAAENDIENIHKSLRLKPAASFDSNASDGKGILQALTTISKLILSSMRKATETAQAAPAPTPVPAKAAVPAKPPAPPKPPAPAKPMAPAKPAAKPSPAEPFAPPNYELTARVEPPSEVATPVLDAPPLKALVLTGVGTPRAVGNMVELPLQLVHEATNEALELTISIRIG